jgi:hypothetical protein
MFRFEIRPNSVWFDTAGRNLERKGASVGGDSLYGCPAVRRVRQYALVGSVE